MHLHGWTPPQLYATALPWNGHPVFSTGNLHSYFARALPDDLRYHLPVSVTLCADRSISPRIITDFLEAVIQWFAYEFRLREERRTKFLELNLFEDKELRKALTRPHAQPWVIYYSEFGGLDILSQIEPNAGVIPCSAMRNHGVAWRVAKNGNCQVWLVSARKVGQDWDWDSDIGHESAHAAFAPVPLFGQALQDELDTIQFDNVQSADDLNHSQLARMCYALTELAVVAVRGEIRATETKLPVGEVEELYQLMNLSRQIFPKMGFGRAYKALAKVAGRVDINSPEMFEMGAAALRAIERTIAFVQAQDITPVVDKIFGTRFRKLQTDSR